MSDLLLVLVVERGPNTGQHIPIRDAVTIGRQADNDLVIADDGLSRHHARLAVQGETLVLTDLGSANGTRVNGVPVVGSQMLRPGDLVELGGTAIRLAPERGAATQVGASPAFVPAPTPFPAAAPYAPAAPAAPSFAPYPGPNAAPPHAAQPARSRLPLILGGVGLLVFLCLCVGIVGIVVLAQGSGGNSTTRATATSIPLFGNGGATQPSTGPRPSIQGGGGAVLPTSAPRPSTQGGGAGGVARGDYLCQSFTTTGLATVGGLHIIIDTRVTYSNNDQPVAGAQQYTYSNPATQTVRFIGGPYDGNEGPYDPTTRVVQVSRSVGCAWQR